MNEKANHPVRTTAKTLGLIETLDASESYRLTELADRMDMSKNGIHNHLSTLREHGYVTRTGDEYGLSLQFLTLGGRVRSRSPLYRHGRATVDQLAADTGMLANLATEEGGQAVYLSVPVTRTLRGQPRHARRLQAAAAQHRHREGDSGVAPAGARRDHRRRVGAARGDRKHHH